MADATKEKPSPLKLLLDLQDRSVVDPEHLASERETFRESERKAGCPEDEIFDHSADEGTQDAYSQDWYRLEALVRDLTS